MIYEPCDAINHKADRVDLCCHFIASCLTGSAVWALKMLHSGVFVFAIPKQPVATVCPDILAETRESLHLYDDTIGVKTYQVCRSEIAELHIGSMLKQYNIPKARQTNWALAKICCPLN